MITITAWPEERTRTPSESRVNVDVECKVDGIVWAHWFWEVLSKLPPALVAAGVTGDAMTIFARHQSKMRQLRYHTAAQNESETVPLPWAHLKSPAKFRAEARGLIAQTPGSSPLAASLTAPEFLASFFRQPASARGPPRAMEPG
jgi:hypothetical protein